MKLFRHKPHPLPSLDAYARWAESYPPEAHNALMRAEEAALLALLPPLDDRIVLDAACGSGRYMHIAQARGARCVIGTDNSWEMLRRIPQDVGRGMPRPYSHSHDEDSSRGEARLARSSLIYPCLSTLDSLPLATASIDVAICGLAIGHLSRIERAFEELARVLVPGGVALVSDVHPFLFLGGAQRTFSSGGKTYAVEHTIHLYSAVHAAAQEVGLHIDAVREPALLSQDRTDTTPNAPVAVVYRMIKV